MAKSIELTLEEAKQHPECFMYVWATDQFLAAIEPKYAKIIGAKRANQKKVLMLSADEYLGGFDKVQTYYNEIAAAFKEAYDMTPYQALIVLARGGTVAGKNWSKEIYGVGTLPTSTFKGITANGKSVTVDKTTGHIYRNNVDITDTSRTVEAEIGGKLIPFQLFGTDDLGTTFMSQYNKTLKKYYAESYQTEDGQKYNAYTGKGVSNSDGSNIWGSITMNWDWVQNILNWLLSIFGLPSLDLTGDSSTSTTTQKKEMLSAENTLPSQKADGFVSQRAGMGETAVILLSAAAAGYLLMGKKKKKSINGCR